MPDSSPSASHVHSDEPDILLIESRAAVGRLRDSLVLPKPRRTGVRIVFHEHLLGPDAARIARRVNDLYADCGCEAGGIAVLLAIRGLTAWWRLPHARLDTRFVFVALAVIGSAAALGKLLGLVRSRILHFSLLLRIERFAKTQSTGVM